MDAAQRKAWLAGQVAKIPGARFRADPTNGAVWVIEYQPADTGTLRVCWWVRHGTRTTAPLVQLVSTHRTLQPEALRHVAAISLALAAWQEHEPRPPEPEEPML